jgi:uncharacterized lipoprotein YddW (UPF0748 family)
MNIGHILPGISPIFYLIPKNSGSILKKFMTDFPAVPRPHLLLVISIFLGISGLAAGPRPGTPITPPKREIRAVWITTVAGLDWPGSTDRDEQRRSLAAIVDRLADARFNAIFFQVRGRADAMYRSAYEPWSAQLTGTLGRDPGWDPLAVLITLAHARGLEVHAWFNTFLVKTGGPRPVATRPEHLLVAHPEWVRDSNGETWCDPGLPQVRNYLVGVALDIVRHYDIDGIQFDYARYPTHPFPDDATWRRYGGGKPRDDWRRNNVNEFIRVFHDSLTHVKPALAVGSTPIGVYNASSGAKGLRGYADVFQDSRKWVREGWMDYLVPQVYWALSDSKNEPNFLNLAREWSSTASGRPVAIGLGAYKPEVLSQLPAMIDSARRCGAAGVAFFRYDNIRKQLGMEGRFRTTALLPPMSRYDILPPEPPSGIGISDEPGGIVSLTWNTPPPASDGGLPLRYCVYRSETRPVDINSSSSLLALLPATTHGYRDTIARSRVPRFYYAVTSIDRSWNESLPAVEKAIVPAVSVLSKEYVFRTMLGSVRHVNGAPVLFIPYELRDAQPVIIRILDGQNREVANVVDAVQPTGRYIGSADVSKLPAGKYTCLMLAGESVLRTGFTIGS